MFTRFFIIAIFISLSLSSAHFKLFAAVPFTKEKIARANTQNIKMVFIVKTYGETDILLVTAKEIAYVLVLEGCIHENLIGL